MAINTNKKQLDRKILTILLILVAFSVGVLVTNNLYSEYVWLKQEASSVEAKLKELKAQNADLTAKQEALKTWDDKVKSEIQKYLVDFDENRILKFFYDYSSQPNKFMEITWISFDRGGKNDLWFMEWNVNLSATFRGEKAMLDFLTYINNVTPKTWVAIAEGDLLPKNTSFKFFLPSFSYALGQQNLTDISVSLPLRVFYVK